MAVILAAEIAEMLGVLDFYLQYSSVSRPIEYFHTGLASFYDRAPVTLWDVQEEDPAYIRYVTDDGKRIEHSLQSNMIGRSRRSLPVLQAYG